MKNEIKTFGFRRGGKRKLFELVKIQIVKSERIWRVLVFVSLKLFISLWFLLQMRRKKWREAEYKKGIFIVIFYFFGEKNISRHYLVIFWRQLNFFIGIFCVFGDCVVNEKPEKILRMCIVIFVMSLRFWKTNFSFGDELLVFEEVCCLDIR